MNSTSPSTSASLPLAAHTTAADTTNAVKKLPASYYESSRFVESKKDFNKDGVVVSCTVLTYTFSRSERIVRFVLFCLGSLLLFPLLSADFRKLCAASQDYVILSKGLTRSASAPHISSAGESHTANSTIEAKANAEAINAAAEEAVNAAIEKAVNAATEKAVNAAIAREANSKIDA